LKLASTILNGITGNHIKVIIGAIRIYLTQRRHNIVHIRFHGIKNSIRAITVFTLPLMSLRHH
jgi:hypothetical protein